MSNEDIKARTRAIDNEIKVLRSELVHLQHLKAQSKDKLKENQEKIKMNKQLPYLVANVVEVCVREYI